MPSHGQHSFLHEALQARKDFAESVSMPSHGQHSFLLDAFRNQVDSLCVSMPSHGQHSFLRTRSAATLSTLMCQCPHTGNTHFYWPVRGTGRCLSSVSMPSHGQHSFLRIAMHWTMCHWKSVNALTRATLISTNDCRRWKWTEGGCVNALTRATLISTYPSKTPYFMRIFDPVFAGNSQNILKKTFFRGFTCMFTVCSYLTAYRCLTLNSVHKAIIAYLRKSHYTDPVILPWCFGILPKSDKQIRLYFSYKSSFCASHRKGACRWCWSSKSKTLSE